MKHFKLLPLAMLAAFGVSAQQVSGTTTDMGSVQTVIDGFVAQHANPQSKFTRSLNGTTMGADIRDFHYKDGKLSITGRAINNSNSLFVLKGNQKKLYGYLVLHDVRKAYEYTTGSDGIVRASEVPMSKIYPDLDEKFVQSNVPPKGLLAVAHPVYSPMALRQAPHIGPYNNEDVTKLESKPGSPYVFFLDTSDVLSGSTPINGVTKENMYRMWQSVADQYSFLKMNVTTNRAVYDAAKAANVLRTGIIHFYNQDGRSNAPLHAFGTTAAGTLYRNPASGFDYGYGIGMTAAHEVGHEMGMNHDHGGTGGEYFEGIPAYQWCPIMGNYWMGGSWQNQLFTWSKGEYTTATNFEDDLNIMNAEEGVPYMDDDISASKALAIGTNGSIDPRTNWGQIARNTDTDTFTFSTNGGTLNLRIDPIEYLRMLDVDATIYNAANAVVAHSNLPVHRSAEFVNLALPAGSYRLVIRGGAEGTPKNGFSNYSSLGYYAMKGTLSGSVVTPDPVLSNGVALPGQSAATGIWKYYVIDVPAGQASVKFSINGSNGDADLFASSGNKPTNTSYQCKSDGPTAVESCTISKPAAGKYYVGVLAYSAFSGLSVTASYSN